MKIYVFALLVVAAVAFARNVPSIEDKMSLESLLANAESLKVAPVEEHHRVRRVTCELLLDDLRDVRSFCAAHCIAKGFKGGYCNANSANFGVCACRMDTLIDKMSLESLLANAESLKVAPVEGHHRVRRVTCDLLDGLGGGHSFCAAHCIVIGYEGGYCNDKGVCVCRGKRRD